MVRAARGEVVERAPCWMMRQAGRYQAAYRALALKHPSFRERSETTELIVDISLQVSVCLCCAIWRTPTNKSRSTASAAAVDWRCTCLTSV